MSILFRVIFISMFSFAYSDCVDLDQTACEAASDCTWHAHEGETPVCEDVVHCDDLDTQAACDAEEDCDWHGDHCDAAHGDTDCSQTDHFDGQGFALEHDETEVYSQLQGAIQGSLEVEVNSTKELAIHFLSLIHI